MRHKYGLPLVFLMIAAFWACSDDVVSEKTEYDVTDDVSSVKDIDDLPDCEEENDGAMYWVSSEKSFRTCKNEEWFAVKPTKVDSVEVNVSCEAEKLKDGSGLKVICNGDSVGVLLNGIDADSVVNLDSLLSDSALLADLLALNLIEKHSEEPPEKQEVELDSEQVIVSLEDVSGYSQKGPFLLGSEVVAYELENGRTLKQTGKQFHGKISDDKGSFNIRTIKVASQYAFLAAKGFYRNEVSGGVSDQQISLNALTDLRSRNIVNINVLTHLEYDRATQLVLKDKYTVRKAKKQAEEEIFKIFHMDSLGIEGVSEDFSISGSGNGDAALLAISVLLQRNSTEAVMQSEITSMSESIAKDGKWNNDSMKMVMADWVSNLELTDSFKVVRENVSGWKLSANEPPAFEPLLHHFWVEEYGIGECSKDRVGEIFAVDNKYSEINKSKSVVRFICVDSSDKDVGYAWRYATDLEKDTENWALGSSDGVLKKGNLTDTKYVYDGVKNTWNYATPLEEQHGGCRQEIYNQIRRVEESYLFYRCTESSHSWEPVYEYTEIDTQGWGKGKDKETRWGDTLGVTIYSCDGGLESPHKTLYMAQLNGSLYYPKYGGYVGSSGCTCHLEEYNDDMAGYKLEVLYEGDDKDAVLQFCNSGERQCYYYDGTVGKWLHASSDHCENNHHIGRCTADNFGEINYSETENRVYECMEYKAEGAYVSEIVWKEVTDDVKANVFNVACDEDKWVTGFFAKDVHFVCDNGQWRKATTMEEYVGDACYLNDQAKEKKSHDIDFLCVNSGWVEKEVYVNTHDLVCSENSWIEGQVDSAVHFVCDEGIWRKASELEELFETPCYSGNYVDYIYWDDDGYYKCEDGTWKVYE